MGFSRQEYWSGLPFPSPGDLPDPGIKPRSPSLKADSLPSETPGKPHVYMTIYKIDNQFSSVQFIHSVVSDSLQTHELQHARPPCPSPTPGVHSNSCPSGRWCHPAISSSVIPFSSCLSPSQQQSLFQWVNSSHEVAKSFSIIPSKEHPGLISFRMEWLDLLAVHGAYRLLLNIEYNSLCYIVGPCWLSILQIVVCIC